MTTCAFQPNTSTTSYNWAASTGSTILPAVGGADLYLPTAGRARRASSPRTAVTGGTAEIFASGTDLATVETHTHFTL